MQKSILRDADQFKPSLLVKLFPLITILMVAACEAKRPQQENYIFDGRQADVRALVAEIERDFDGTVMKTDLQIANADPSVMYKITSSLANITVTSSADNRCTPRMNGHLTFRDKQFEVDLVYKKKDEHSKRLARARIEQSARRAGQQLRRLVVC